METDRARIMILGRGGRLGRVAMTYSKGLPTGDQTVRVFGSGVRDPTFRSVCQRYMCALVSEIFWLILYW